LTLSNFGTIGTGFAGWPSLPSCQYPANSGVEHLFIGGLWVGGVIDEGGNRVTAVSTGAVDVSSVRDLSEGFEMRTTSPMRERSSDIASLFFSPDAVSEQDFIADFTDANRRLPGRDPPQPIPNHVTPLNLAVHLESYAWSFPFADNFVILRYTITNVSTKVIDSFRVGFWADGVVRNTLFTPPGGSAFYTSGGNGFDTVERNISWQFTTYHCQLQNGIRSEVGGVL